MEVVVVFVVVGLFFLVLFRSIVRFVRERGASLEADAAAAAAKSEAFFRATFPDLQPHFHPANVAEYVLARMGKGFAPVTGVLEKPPGFEAAVRARITTTPKGEQTILDSGSGSRLAEFVLEAREGAIGALRLGAGKFTVRRNPGEAVKVKYWHPDREFEWSPPARWKFTTRLADEPIDSSDRGTTWSDSPSSGVRTAAPFAGAGGTFDGGGASAGWDASAAGSESASTSSGGTGGAGESTSTSY